MKTILSAETPDEEARQTLDGLGLAPTVLNAIHLGMSEKAAKGDPSAAKYLRDLAEGGGREETEAAEDADPLPGLSALSDRELRRLAARFRTNE